jgi:adenosylmethionine---8-amino-7-oxononanoate aminotransferase
LRPIGRTVYFMPPYVIDEEAWALLLQGSLECIDVCA